LPSGKKEPEFWTDSNGIKMMRRIKDFRTGYDFHVEDPVSANFYPVNSMFSIREKTSNSINYSINEYEGLTNENKMISYMVDRSESIGALKKGQFIVIQNRQSYTDDRKGMADGLLKEASSFKINFKIKSYLVFDNNPNLIKQIENKIQNRFALFTSIVNINYKKTKKDNNKNTKKYINTAKKGKGIEYQKRFLNEFSKNFSTSSNGNKNLIMNIHILNNNKVYLQFFNNCDLFHENNCLAQEINLIEKDGLKFTEYAFNGTTPLNKDFIKQKSISMKINPFDFKLFLIEFTEIDD
jgi:hypothetical protein